jgi:hypothetical protein
VRTAGEIDEVEGDMTIGGCTLEAGELTKAEGGWVSSSRASMLGEEFRRRWRRALNIEDGTP